MEPTPEKENEIIQNIIEEEEASLSPNANLNVLTKTSSEIKLNSNSEFNQQRNFIKPKNYRFSADFDLIKNNLIEKNFGIANSNSNSNSNKFESSKKGEKNLKPKNSDNFINQLSSSQTIKSSENQNFSNFKNLAQSVNLHSASSNAISAAFKLNKSNSLVDKINSVINLQPIDLLKRIFLNKKSEELSNLIINNREIEKVLLYLYHCKSMYNKAEVIEFLKKNFLESPQNVEIFNANIIEIFSEEISEWKKLSLYQILFILITKDDISFKDHGDFINLVLTILRIMAEQANCSKEIFEFVFQDLSHVFKKSKNDLVCPQKENFLGVANFENREKISSFIKKNIQILKALYSKCSYVEKPQNFFYFNGSDYLKIKEKCFIEERIPLKEGFSVLFWIKPDFSNSKELGIDNNLINIKCQKNFSINITLKENQILIRNSNSNSTNPNNNTNLNNNKNANVFSKDEKICSHDHEFYNRRNSTLSTSSTVYNQANSSSSINYNSDWIFVGITFKKKTSKKAIIKFYINNTSNEYPSEFFDFDNEITEIQLFNRFCGYATSFMFFDDILNEKQMELIKEDKKGSEKFHGIYSENKLNKLLRKINSKHLENSDFEKLEALFNNANSSNLDLANKKDSSANKNKANLNNNQNNINDNNNNFAKYEILKDLFTKNLRIFFAPMRKSERIVYDLTNTHHANLASFEKLNSGLCGVRIFHNFQKNIFLLGGINNILPIIELMWLSDTYRKNFVEFMELISQILFEREKNMQDAIEKNFFQILSIFIEKFEKEIFDARLLQIFKDLLKHFFSCIGKNNLCKIFLDNILLNVKILLKFEISLQIEIWKTLYQCYVSDPTEINKFMNIKSLSSIVINLLFTMIYYRFLIKIFFRYKIFEQKLNNIINKFRL